MSPDDLGVSELSFAFAAVVCVLDADADDVLLHAAGRGVRRTPVRVDRVLRRIEVNLIRITFLKSQQPQSDFRFPPFALLERGQEQSKLSGTKTRMRKLSGDGVRSIHDFTREKGFPSVCELWLINLNSSLV